MAVQSILVEDGSPMIQYAPPDAWQDAQANDTLAASYSGGSYHVTAMQGATATFQFRGTGFTITGGRRPGYGPFSISLDGKQLFDGSPVPGSSPVKNNLAFVSGLSDDFHTVVLTNTGGAPVDIDTVTFETQIGSAGSNPAVTTIDDNDSRINYLPSPGAWKMNPRPEFRDNTLHYSSDDDAAFSLQFTGNAVALYGTLSPDHADVSITIDGKTVTMPSGSMNRVLAVRSQVLLYWADGLADGQHNMTVSKVQSFNTGPFIDIDSVDIYSAQTLGAENSTSGAIPPSNGSSLQPANSSGKSSTTHAGVIAGASIAGVVALLLIAVGLFLFLRQRRLRQESNIIKASISPITPILPMQSVMESGMAQPPAPGGDNPAFPLPPPAQLAPSRKSRYNKRSSKLSVAPSYYGDPEFSSGSTQMYESRPQVTFAGSSNPLNSSVPRVATPRAPGSLRTVPTSVVRDTSSPSQRSRLPYRPRRPPTLNIGSLQ